MSNTPRVASRTRLSIVFFAGLFALSLFIHQIYLAPRVQAVSTSIVISQFQVAGGTAADEFVELHNVSGGNFDLNGHRLVYRSAAGTSDVSVVNWTTTTIIPAGGYYLIGHTPGYDGTPAANITYNLGATGTLAAAGGGLAIRNGAVNSGTIVDSVGFGTATNAFVESAVTTAPAANQSKARLNNGCTDTDNNAADFATLNPSVPRSSATTPITCGGDTPPSVTSTVPTNGATNVALASDITVNFSEPVNASVASFTISCANSGGHSFALSGGPSSFLLNPDVNFTANESCTVTVIASQVTDQDGSSDNMTANFSASFTTVDPPQACGDPATFIHDVQGSGATSPITGSTVSIEGIVTADHQGAGQFSGYYVQEEDSDADVNDLTSEGIFVFSTSFPVNVGDKVRVRGTVTEFNGLTEITSVSSTLTCSINATLPALIDVNLPVTSISDFERYEGMLVRMPQELVIAEYFNYERFGELVIALPLPGESRPFTGTAIDEPGAPANARTLANSLRRITLDDVLNTQNPATLRHPNGDPFSLANRFRGGDTVQNTVGVLTFNFDLYRIQPTAPATYVAVNPRPASPDAVGGNLRVAAMNTLNFFLTEDPPSGPLDNKCGPAQNMECRGADSDQPTEFTRQRDKLIAALAGLNGDVIGLNELENTTGVDPLGDPTKGIVAGLNAIYGPGTYDYINTGTIGTDAIRVGLIYRPSRVAPVGAFQILDSTDDPRFIDTKSRPALAQTFQDSTNGARFTVVVNHLKSKGSDCNDVSDPDTGDGSGNCNGTRTLAAQALVDWLATDPTGSGDPDFLIMGDLNSYTQEDPIDAIKAGADDTAGTSDDFANLIAYFEGTYAYSYTFDGAAGYLDHSLASSSLFPQVTGATEWHINSDEPDVLDYDTTFKPPSQDALYEPNAYRSSDHDAVVIGLILDADNDGVPDATDNCPNVANPNQENNDGDSLGDACDPDDDNDNVLDANDNCPFTANSDQANNDGDSLGDACDPDDDNDGDLDANDNCPFTANSDQANNDGDSLGDACDPDDDNDNVLDANDNCPFVANTDQANNDGDAAGDVCDTDDDNDGDLDANDNCPFTANSDQANNDGDSFGDACDADDDNDGVLDVDDNCQFTANPDQADFDLDGIGDACDLQTGPPTNKDQCKNGGWALFDFPRTFNNQGDCIQYVNTGK